MFLQNREINEAINFEQLRLKMAIKWLLNCIKFFFCVRQKFTSYDVLIMLQYAYVPSIHRFTNIFYSSWKKWDPTSYIYCTLSKILMAVENRILFHLIHFLLSTFEKYFCKATWKVLAMLWRVWNLYKQVTFASSSTAGRNIKVVEAFNHIVGFSDHFYTYTERCM